MTRTLSIAVAAALFTACAQGPDDVAEDFWSASRDGDAEAARSLVSSSSSMRIDDDASPPIESFFVGDATVEGSEARVPTTLMVDMGDATREVSFDTEMVEEDGVWRVDLDVTTSRMVGRLLGVAFEDMGTQLGEIMQGALEGMAAGMREFGEAMENAVEEAEERSRNR